MTPPVPLADLFTSQDLFALLEVSLTGINLLRPVYEPDGSTITDFALEYVNPAGQRMTGLTEQPGGTLLGRFPHTLAEGVFQYYQRVFETGEQLTYETNYQAEGLDNFFQFSARRSGAHLLVSFTDTSDQNRSAVEQALRESQAAEQAARAEAERELLQALLTQAPVAIGLFQGEDVRVTAANSLMAAMWGYTPEQVVGRPLVEGVPELRGQGFDDLLREVLRTQVPVSGTETPAVMRRDGELKTTYYNFVYQPLYNAAGEVLGVIDVAVDVTEQVRARQELETQQRQLQEVFAQAPVALFVLRGAEYRFEVVNPSMGELLGRPPDQLLGQRYFDVLPALAEQGYRDLLAQVWHSGQPYVAQEQAAQLPHHRDGEPGYYNFTYVPLRDAEQRVTGIMCVCVDVTAQVLARQQVQQLNEELAAINEELRASNEEYQQANTDLSETQQQVQQLNQELEARVQARTHEVETARATTERQRRQWEALFRTAPAGICIFEGPEWVYQFVNPGYQAMFPGRALLGKRLVDALPEVADQPLMAILHRVYDTGEPFQANEVLVPLARTEGGPVEDIYFDLTYLVRRNEAGQIDGFVTYAYDVTEQVLARQERAAQQQQVLEIFEQAPVAIFVLRSLEYVFDVVNPSMAELIGSPPEQILGQRYFDLLPALVEQGYPELVAQVWHSGQPYVAQEQAARLPRHGAGGMGYYNFTYVPLRDAQETTIGIICVAVDVTHQVLTRQQVQDLNEELAAINEELTATNEELNESNTQLTRTNVDLDTFVYTASHDLKAPITNIESITLALRDTLPPAVQQDEMIAHLLDLLEHTTTRFQATIDQLTDLSKLQLAHAGPAEAVNLAAAVESVRLDLVPVLTNVHLTVEVAPDLLVSFSPANLRSAIYNLLSNAVKYRALDRPAQVRLRAFPAGARVVLEVQDNGLGMSAVQQRQLFGLFQRLHTHVEGTGVGLYITKRLVENGGGTIAVESQVAVGTTFTLTFPA